MVASVRAAAAPAIVPPVTAARRERLFFSGMAITLAIVVFVGFAPTYYLRSISSTTFQMTPIVHLHGAVFTAWVLLLVTQTSLIATHRVKLHQRLGMAGAGIATLLVIMGIYVTILRARDGFLAQPGGPPTEAFMAIPLFSIVMFALLFGAALYYRRQSAIHKRLVIISTIEIATAAVARFPVISAMGPPAFFAATDLLLIPMVIYDLVTRRRIHPATLIAGLAVIGVQVFRLWLSGTAGWQSFAGWMIG